MLGQDHKALTLTPLSDDHSRVEPPLPIPNRTVKRSRANDSRHLACESRSSSDSLSVREGTKPSRTSKTPSQKEGVFYWEISRPSHVKSNRCIHESPKPYSPFCGVCPMAGFIPARPWRTSSGFPG